MAGIGRRRFLTYGAGLLVPAGFGVARLGPFDWGETSSLRAAGPLRPTLPGTEIPKFQEALTVLPAMPRTRRLSSGAGPVDYYEIAQRQFTQQVLPRGLPATTVWGYGSVHHASSFHAPAFTLEASVGRPVRVRWINGLKGRRGRFLPPIVPVDPTLHWANPGGGVAGRDSMSSFESTPGPYTGPVPMVVHLHGSERSSQESDGYPEAWFLPDAADIPTGYAREGSFYDRFRQSSPLGRHWGPGTATFEYPNDQDAATLWYHDHVLGLTRVTVYAGLAGLYVLRGEEHRRALLPGPAPRPGDAAGVRYREIPLVIQDRSFSRDGSLFYPGTREALDGFAGPYIPESDVPPIWVPGFLGDAMTVNGRTWPYLDVEPCRYRFRILNACNARVLILQPDTAVPVWQIGADGGFLPTPVPVERLLLAPSERADVIVDFSGLAAGTTVTLRNLGPENGPFFGGEPEVDFPPSAPETTGQVLQFRVGARSGRDDSTPPDQLRLAGASAVAASAGPSVRTTRRVSLNDVHSDAAPHGHLMGVLGTVTDDRSGQGLGWHDAASETPRVGSTEIWEVYNFTGEAHPVHVHATQFHVLDRQPMGSGPARPAAAGEAGRKDTVVSYPGEITRIQAHFPRAGLFTWHCHIIEHEDKEMMRPLHVVE